MTKMGFVEHVTLNPFEKHSRFERFPWKLTLHMLLVVLCTYQSLRIVSIQDKHNRIQENVFSTVYLQGDGDSKYVYYTLDEFTDAFLGVVDQTESLGDVLLQRVETGNTFYQLHVYYSTVHPAEMNQKSVIEGNATSYLDQLSQMKLEPSSYFQMKKFLGSVEGFKLSIKGLLTQGTANGASQRRDFCLNWTINITYSFETSASIDSALEAISYPCSGQSDSESTFQSLLFVHLMIAAASLISLVLHWKRIYSVSGKYAAYIQQASAVKGPLLDQQGQKVSRDTNQIPSVQFIGSSSSISFGQQGVADILSRLRFYDLWFCLTVLGNFLQFFGAIIAILDDYISENLAIFEQKEGFVGYGVLLIWVTLLKYLKFSSRLNLLSETISKSWKNLSAFLLGLLPFFFGFIFLGQALFWKFDKFQSTGKSFVTLFAMANGDIVNDTFLQTWSEGLPGQLYLTAYMILFYTAAQNVFVTIIMEGYEDSIKEREQLQLQPKRLQEEKAHFENHLRQIQQQAHSDKTKKINLLLEQMQKLCKEVQSSDVSEEQKDFLLKLALDHLYNLKTKMAARS